MKEAQRGGINSCSNMVAYDQWSYMTIFGIFEVVFIVLSEGIKIDRLLFENSLKESAVLQEYRF